MLRGKVETDALAGEAGIEGLGRLGVGFDRLLAYDAGNKLC